VEGVRTDVQVSEPSVRIVDVARETRPSLVVMGSRGLTGLQRLLLGSVSNHVAHRSPASVLLAHPPVVA
jgi:nucleotide-binding universal stress UspA family protein